MNVLALVSALLLFASAIARPTRGACPGGFYTAGVRPSGGFLCVRPYGCVERQGPRGGWTSECAGELELESDVYCTSGEVAITRDGVTVGCEMRH
jgi:hypothetical protein